MSIIWTINYLFACLLILLPFIQELKFFGALLPVTVLTSLLTALQTGFQGLRILEFATTLTVASTNSSDTDNITSRIGGTARLPIRSNGGRGANRVLPYTPVVKAANTTGSLAEAVVQAAKDRAYSGRNGLSVTVNYR